MASNYFLTSFPLPAQVRAGKHSKQLTRLKEHRVGHQKNQKPIIYKS